MHQQILIAQIIKINILYIESTKTIVEFATRDWSLIVKKVA